MNGWLLSRLAAAMLAAWFGVLIVFMVCNPACPVIYLKAAVSGLMFFCASFTFLTIFAPGGRPAHDVPGRQDGGRR